MTEDVDTTAEGVETALVPAIEVARRTAPRTAANGLRYASFAENGMDEPDLERLVQAVPAAVAPALKDCVYYFVPLAMAESRPAPDGNLVPDSGAAHPDETMISPQFSPGLAELATCHRNVALDSTQGVFISTRLLPDRFSLSFEFFINAGHGLVHAAGVPESFSDLVWRQATSDVRGETSHEAWEQRAAAMVGQGGRSVSIDERAKTAYVEAAFSDAVAIYMLSLAIDFDYAELRERDYPLLAPQPLVERLRHVNGLFPANSGYEFSTRYRRRG